MKVYCNLCKYLNISIYGEPFCKAPKNIYKKDTWMYKDVIYTKKSDEINKNNDCEWFNKE